MLYISSYHCDNKSSHRGSLGSSISLKNAEKIDVVIHGFGFSCLYDWLHTVYRVVREVMIPRKEARAVAGKMKRTWWTKQSDRGISNGRNGGKKKRDSHGEKKIGRMRGEKGGRNIKHSGRGKGLAAMCNFVVGRACVLCHGQPGGENVKCGRIARWERWIEEKRGRGKKIEPAGFHWRATYRCHGQFLSSYLLGGHGWKSWRGPEHPGKMCFTRERKCRKRRVQLELMIHDGTRF